MSSSEEQTTSQEGSEETSGESSTECPKGEISAEESLDLSHGSDSATNSGDDDSSYTEAKCLKETQLNDSNIGPSSSDLNDSSENSDHYARKKKSSRRSKKLKAYKSGTKPRRSRSTTASTTDETDSSQKTDEATDKSSTKVQVSSASGGDSGESSTEVPNWSMSEDFILLNMRNDHRKPSWKEIAQTMHKSKKDVKARWRILQDKMEQPSSQDEISSEAEMEEPERPKKKSKRRKGKGSSKRKLGTPEQETAILSGEEASTEVSVESSSSERASSSSSSEGESLTYAGSDQEIRHQKRYLQKHIRSRLFPPDKYPKADETFSQEDCEVLASAESQYKRSKWLEIQANFYNATGRLVPIEMIRARFESSDDTDT